MDRYFTEKKAHKIHKNILNLINNERNSNENHNKVPFQTNHISKTKCNNIICW